MVPSLSVVRNLFVCMTASDLHQYVHGDTPYRQIEILLWYELEALNHQVVDEDLTFNNRNNRKQKRRISSFLYCLFPLSINTSNIF